MNKQAILMILKKSQNKANELNCYFNFQKEKNIEDFRLIQIEFIIWMIFKLNIIIKELNFMNFKNYYFKITLKNYIKGF